MVQILPFKGLRYAMGEHGHNALQPVIAPPYDVISPELQQVLMDRHPANIIRLTLNPQTTEDTEANNRYTRARDHFNAWQQDGTLVPEEHPAIYLYQQTFQDPVSGEAVTRSGFLAMIEVTPYEDKKILPHEWTLKGPKADRLSLFQTMMANPSPIFLVYDDPEREVESLSEDDFLLDDPAHPGWITVDTLDDTPSVTHRIRPLTNPKLVEAVQAVLANRQALIADGHHRYETALGFRDWVRGQLPDAPAPGSLASDYTLAFLANLADADRLPVYPTHRAFRALPDGWTAERLESAILTVFDRTEAPALGQLIYWGPSALAAGAPWYLTPRAEAMAGILPDLGRLDVVLLDRLVVSALLGSTSGDMKASKALWFDQDVEALKAGLGRGDYHAVFEMQRPDLRTILSVSAAGERMPQKSTYFYPKIIDGLALSTYGRFAAQEGHAFEGLTPAIAPVSLAVNTPVGVGQ